MKNLPTLKLYSPAGDRRLRNSTNSTNSTEVLDQANLSLWSELDAVAIAAIGSDENQSPKLILSKNLRSLEMVLGISVTELLLLWPDFVGKAGELIEIPVKHSSLKISRIYIVGVGSQGPEDLRKAGAALGRKVKNSGKVILDLSLPAHSKTTTKVNYGVIGHLVSLVLSNYSWSMKTNLSIKPVKYLVCGANELEISRATTLISAVWKARDLIHTPANIKTPAWMALQSKNQILTTKSPDLKIEVLSGKALNEFGGLQAIGGSSPNPGPRFIKISYAPSGSKNWPHVVLVGKGITFDSGGISLKRPYDLMVPMKSDMSGAAVVLSVVTAMPEIRPSVRVTALLMCAENMLSATSARPSDVITQYGGKTVEVINTDAEGRLVLADGLAYADLNLDPDYLIDIATLTGAASLGLSKHYGAMYGRNKTLVRKIGESGDRVGERVWHMPLIDEYSIALKSEIADFNHTAKNPEFDGGSITAALFLEQFVGKRNWIHLDIAGPSRSEVDAGENVKGGTGFGVRLLIDWLASI